LSSLVDLAIQLDNWTCITS